MGFRLEVVTGTQAKEWSLVDTSVDGKYHQAASKEVFYNTNLQTAIGKGLVEIDDSGKMTLVKGRTFVNSDGYTCFTESTTTSAPKATAVFG